MILPNNPGQLPRNRSFVAASDKMSAAKDGKLGSRYDVFLVLSALLMIIVSNTLNP
ncbi:hypothetical protein AGR1A_Lc50188 [Agrobacterium fabacearum CFBP 5771]|nr:hypothetical protein AGR1A_Lc50188 [Agrobacterium fabacearum CFBP 5771]